MEVHKGIFSQDSVRIYDLVTDAENLMDFFNLGFKICDMTQGETRDEALFMVKDAIMEYVKYYFEAEADNFELTVNEYKKTVIGITSNNNKLLLALSLRKQREKSGSTVREASERLGSKSPNSYAQYEKGKTRISLDQYEKLLQAANPYQHRLLLIR